MSLKKKFRIKNLDKKKKFQNNAFIVLYDKLKTIKRLTKKYLKDESSESLHQLRIAIRRFRYTMEIFVDCFKEKDFENAYKLIQYLQDKLGEGRDLDVLEEKLKLIVESKNISINDLLDQINKEKSNIKQTIKEELLKFAEEKETFNFLIKK